MKKILVVDDEEEARNFAVRLLKKEGFIVSTASNGKEALKNAGNSPPDLILLDVTMPEMDGLTVCRKLRENVRTRFIPVIIISSKDAVPDKVQGFSDGADDYLSKPCDPAELKARVQTLLLRNERNLSTNPLTRLPGNPSIEEEVNHRIEKKFPFAFAYLDIDHFKAYNDLYGFKKGDEVIQLVASLILKYVQENGDQQSFAGHIGGDDFIFITNPSVAEQNATAIADSFDESVSDFYSAEDKNRGFVMTKSRQGQIVQSPLMTLSIVIVTNEKRVLTHYGKVVEIASEMKHYAKTLPDRTGSIVVKDKRRV